MDACRGGSRRRHGAARGPGWPGSSAAPEATRADPRPRSRQRHARQVQRRPAHRGRPARGRPPDMREDDRHARPHDPAGRAGDAGLSASARQRQRAGPDRRRGGGSGSGGAGHRVHGAAAVAPVSQRGPLRAGDARDHHQRPAGPPRRDGSDRRRRGARPGGHGAAPGRALHRRGAPARHHRGGVPRPEGAPRRARGRRPPRDQRGGPRWVELHRASGEPRAGAAGVSGPGDRPRDRADRDVGCEPRPGRDDRARARLLRAAHRVRQRVRGERPGVDRAGLADDERPPPRPRELDRGLQLPQGPGRPQPAAARRRSGRASASASSCPVSTPLRHAACGRSTP